MPQLTCRFTNSITDITKQQWQRLFTDSNPFTQYEFIKALETSQSTIAANGWSPQHILVYDNELLVAAMPCYLKNHSYGEYIFDWGWAEAYHKNGIEYYPKLLSAIPYTPVTGERLGVTKDYQTNKDEIIKTILNTIHKRMETDQISNWQCLFCNKELSQQLKQQSCLQRIEVQYHWFNRSYLNYYDLNRSNLCPNYENFEDFLAHLKPRKRKNIQRERKKIAKADIKIQILEGEQITLKTWQQFYRFYHITYLKKTGQTGYLNFDFFVTLGKNMPQQIVLIIAQKDNEIVAGSLYLKSKDTLYGRYWGCDEHFNFLHFECCYYQGIQYCINNQLKLFNAGAQGEHKIDRGFEPVINYANYQIHHPQFKAAITDYVIQETQNKLAYVKQLNERSAYKKPG